MSIGSIISAGGFTFPSPPLLSLEGLEQRLREGWNLSSVITQYEEVIRASPERFFDLLKRCPLVKFRDVPDWVGIAFSPLYFVWASDRLLWHHDWLMDIPKAVSDTHLTAYFQLAQKALGKGCGYLRDLTESVWEAFPEECYQIAEDQVSKERGTWSDLPDQAANKHAEKIFKFIQKKIDQNEFPGALIRVSENFALQNRTKYLEIVRSLIERSPFHVQEVLPQLYPELFEQDFRKIPKKFALMSHCSHYYALAEQNISEGKGSLKDVPLYMASDNSSRYFQLLRSLLFKGITFLPSDIFSVRQIQVDKRMNFKNNYENFIQSISAVAFRSFKISEEMRTSCRRFLENYER